MGTGDSKGAKEEAGARPDEEEKQTETGKTKAVTAHGGYYEPAAKEMDAMASAPKEVAGLIQDLVLPLASLGPEEQSRLRYVFLHLMADANHPQAVAAFPLSAAREKASQLLAQAARIRKEVEDMPKTPKRRLHDLHERSIQAHALAILKPNILAQSEAADYAPGPAKIQADWAELRPEMMGGMEDGGTTPDSAFDASQPGDKKESDTGGEYFDVSSLKGDSQGGELVSHKTLEAMKKKGGDWELRRSEDQRRVHDEGAVKELFLTSVLGLCCATAVSIFPWLFWPVVLLSLVYPWAKWRGWEELPMKWNKAQWGGLKLSLPILLTVFLAVSMAAEKEPRQLRPVTLAVLLFLIAPHTRGARLFHYCLRWVKRGSGGARSSASRASRTATATATAEDSCPILSPPDGHH